MNEREMERTTEVFCLATKESEVPSGGPWLIFKPSEDQDIKVLYARAREMFGELTLPMKEALDYLFHSAGDWRVRRQRWALETVWDAQARRWQSREMVKGAKEEKRMVKAARRREKRRRTQKRRRMVH